MRKEWTRLQKHWIKPEGDFTTQEYLQHYGYAVLFFFLWLFLLVLKFGVYCFFGVQNCWRAVKKVARATENVDSIVK